MAHLDFYSEFRYNIKFMLLLYLPHIKFRITLFKLTVTISTSKDVHK